MKASAVASQEHCAEEPGGAPSPPRTGCHLLSPHDHDDRKHFSVSLLSDAEDEARALHVLVPGKLLPLSCTPNPCNLPKTAELELEPWWSAGEHHPKPGVVIWKP